MEKLCVLDSKEVWKFSSILIWFCNSEIVCKVMGKLSALNYKNYKNLAV